MRAWRRSAAALLAVALVASCGTQAEPSDTSAPEAPAAAAPGLTPVTVEVPSGMRQPPFDVPRQALVPPGWTMSVFSRVPRVRMAAFAPDGALLVSVPYTGEVVRLNQAGERTLLLRELTQPHGLAFAGDTLYVAESNQISAFRYADEQAVDQRVLVGDLPNASSRELRAAYAHVLKSVAIGDDGTVYFSIGSTGNISAEDRDATPPRATIMRVSPGGGVPEPFTTGVRNGTGLAVAPDGAVWTAVNGRDNVLRPEDGRLRSGYVNDHPPEAVAKLFPGRELGWPFCNPDGGPANLPLIRDVETNADGSRMDCAALPPIEQSMGAHSAPLGMSFADLPEPYGIGALIGVHGSWNRTPPRAPEVSFFPWREGLLGDQQTLVGGFQLPDGFRWGRPVSAVQGPDGAVYITDDLADAVYRLAPPA
jgi:glucose/arabinose dehydrogenase